MVGRGEEEIIFWKLSDHEWCWRKGSRSPGITISGPWPSFERALLSAEYHYKVVGLAAQLHSGKRSYSKFSDSEDIMTTGNPGKMLNEMLLLVTNRFNGKYDKGGKPYVLHCLKVMHYLKTEDEELQCVALGHDLVEDTGTTYSELRNLGFSERVVEGIRSLTKVPGETPEEYLEKIKGNRDAILVKLQDLRHNSDIRRLKGVKEKDIHRMVKYHNMYIELKNLV